MRLLRWGSRAAAPGERFSNSELQETELCRPVCHRPEPSVLLGRRSGSPSWARGRSSLGTRCDSGGNSCCRCSGCFGPSSWTNQSDRHNMADQAPRSGRAPDQADGGKGDTAEDSQGNSQANEESQVRLHSLGSLSCSRSVPGDRARVAFQGGRVVEQVAGPAHRSRARLCRLVDDCYK